MDEKPTPALEIYNIWDMANAIPYLVSTSFQESICPYNTSYSKLPGSAARLKFEAFNSEVVPF